MFIRVLIPGPAGHIRSGFRAHYSRRKDTLWYLVVNVVYAQFSTVLYVRMNTCHFR